MTSDTPGSGEPRPPDPEPTSPDPGAVTAPYTPPLGSTESPPDPPSSAAPPSGTAAPGWGAPPAQPSLPPGVGWAPAVAVRPEIAPGLTFSDTPSRFVAWFIDGILLFVLDLIISAVLQAVGLETSGVRSFTGQSAETSVSVYSTTNTLGTIATVAVSAAYFIGSWSGGRRATMGQRMLSIQVGNAFDGRALTLDQAIRRWLGLGYFIVLIGFIPGLAALSGLWLIWIIVLFITTATSSTKQGIHDRIANSAVVRPVTAGNSWAMACAVIAIALAVLALLAIVSLIFLGGQVSAILSTVGDSV